MGSAHPTERERSRRVAESPREIDPEGPGAREREAQADTGIEMEAAVAEEWNAKSLS